jgi:hypothetical protein
VPIVEYETIMKDKVKLNESKHIQDNIISSIFVTLTLYFLCSKKKKHYTSSGHIYKQNTAL